MAQSGRTNRIYLDNQINLQLPISKEHPEGEVRVLRQGWNEIPDDLMDHPVIKRLRPETENEGARREKVREAEQERSEALSKIEVEYAEKLNEVEKERREELRQKSEERAQRVQEREAKGEVSYEPNPDPDAAHAEALTQSPNTHVVSASGMAYKGDESVAAGQRRVMEQGMSGSQGGQPNQGSSGYARQEAAHRTTSPVVDEEGKPVGTNKDEITGVNTEGAGTATPTSHGSGGGSSRNRG